MMEGELTQYPLPFGSKHQEDFSPVLTAAPAPHIAARGQPIRQLHRAVMLNLQTLGQFADSWPDAFWQSFHGQHQLMLPRFQASSPGGLLTEVQKTTDLVTQIRQCLEVRT
jgi:hypothetical protein